MTVNGGGPNGSNILTTHPKRKKLGFADKQPKKNFLPEKEEVANSQESSSRERDRVYRLADLPATVRNAFLSNLIDAHSHRIDDINSEDIATAFKSLPDVRGLPLKTKDENNAPIVIVRLADRKAKTIITVEDTLQYLQ
ncbi:hypothetical protein IPM19_00260 [bacterium]|nr:MAG: hypothetical protein IPM19_00260 [bacterium]